MSTIVDLDISMGKKYIFNYEYFDEAKSQLNGSDYRLYFVLLGDKISIDNFEFTNKILTVNCINEFNSETYNISMDILESMRVDSIEHILLRIIDNGNLLEVSYTDKGLNFLMANHPEQYKICFKEIETNGLFSIKLHAKNILQLGFANDDNMHTFKYQLMYIGQSNQKNIFDRIENHSTIQKIHREVGKRFKGKSLEIMLCDVHCKIIDRTMISQYNTEMVLASSLEKSFELYDSIRRKEAIDIAEAILIAHFKPEFNTYMKNIDLTLKTYSRFKNVEINAVHFSLDLYWETVKEKSVLITESMTANTLGRVITCTFSGNESGISYNDLEELYF